MNLCEIGDVSHLDWKEEYKCKSSMGKRIIEDIQSKSNEFEQRYNTCKERINSLRMKYHELNFFTIQQLLFLRKELAGLKQSSTVETLNLQAYTLLEKVLPCLHRALLRDALLEAGIKAPHLDRDDYSDEDTLRSATNLSEEKDDHSAGDEQTVEKYDTLLNNLEKLNLSEPERLAVAALVENRDGSETDLVIWCVQNKDNSDSIDELYNAALEDPSFRGIVDQNAESDEESSQSSQDSGDDQRR